MTLTEIYGVLVHLDPILFMFESQGQRSKLRFGIESETEVGKPLKVKVKLGIPVIRPLLRSRPKFETVNK